MLISLSTPHSVCASDGVMIPAAGDVTADDRLFVICDNHDLVAALIEHVNECFDPEAPFTPDEFNRALNRALDSQRDNITRCNLAFMLIHCGGILVAQMGKSRILHVKRGARGADYDSRDQVQDIYSGRAKVQQLVNLDPDDYVLLTLAPRTDADALSRTLASPQLDDSARLDAAAAMLRNADGSPATTLIVRVSDVAQRGYRRLSDLNWRWGLFYLLLAAAIAGVATLSFNSRLIWDNHPTNEQAAADTTATPVPTAAVTDTATPPLPVVEPLPDLPDDTATPGEPDPEVTKDKPDPVPPASVEKVETPSQPAPHQQSSPTAQPDAPSEPAAVDTSQVLH